jgi:hypothetical protein
MSMVADAPMLVFQHPVKEFRLNGKVEIQKERGYLPALIVTLSSTSPLPS